MSTAIKKQVGPSTHPHYIEIDEKAGDVLVEEKEVKLMTDKFVTTENHEALELKKNTKYSIGQVQQYNPMTKIFERVRD